MPLGKLLYFICISVFLIFAFLYFFLHEKVLICGTWQGPPSSPCPFIWHFQLLPLQLEEPLLQLHLADIIIITARGAFFAWRAPILSWPRIMCSQVRMLKFLEMNILYWEINIDLVWKVAFHPNCPVKHVFIQNIYFHSTSIVEFSRQTSTFVKICWIPDTWMKLVRFPDFQLPSASLSGSFFLYQLCSSNTSIYATKKSFCTLALFLKQFFVRVSGAPGW